MLGGYKHIYTAGSSKGGTCAIYYGLKYNVDEVYASACQYHIGKYLSNKPKVLIGMMGKHYTGNSLKTLDNMVPNMIKEHALSKTIINCFYSEKEHTYEKHIVDLKKDLEESGIKYTVTTDDYTAHGENGIYFSAHLKRIFNR